MNTTNKAIINSIGVEISIKIDLDVADNTAIELRYTKPDATVGKWVKADGVDYVLDNTQHFIRYTTTSVDDIDQKGVWYFQVRVTGPGYDLYGTRARYTFEELMPGTY